MLSLAVTLALAFWTPYSPEPVCPQGVQVISYNYGGLYTIDNGLRVRPTRDTYAFTSLDTMSCIVWMNVRVRTVPEACVYIIHEIGHNWFGLRHTTERNVMNEHPYIPGICYSRQ